MLSLADMLNLIRLTELELDKLQSETESDDQQVSGDAGEMVVQMDDLAQKLKTMYTDARPDDSELPTYDEYIETISK